VPFRACPSPAYPFSSYPFSNRIALLQSTYPSPFHENVTNLPVFIDFLNLSKSVFIDFLYLSKSLAFGHRLRTYMHIYGYHTS